MTMNHSHCVCHISTVHPTFDQRIFHRECWSVQRAGHITHLIVQNDQVETEVDGIHIHALDRSRKNTPGMRIFRRVWRIVRANKLARRIRADIYHLHDPELIPLGLWLKLTTRKPIIFDCHENNVAYIKQKYYLPQLLRSLLNFGMMQMERLAARYFDAIITADAGVADIFRQKYHAKNVEIIHNFPRLDLFLDNRNTNLQISPSVDLVYHGTIPKYHLEVAFNVANELQKRGRHVTWLFFGNGPSVEWVDKELQQRGLQKVFTYDPHRIPHEQVAARVRQARLGFIPLPDLPKFQHNIPTKLFEYMALKMPVVLSDLPPSRALVGDGKAVIMVPPDDYQAYADAIERLLDDDILRKQMGEAGYQRVIERFNWESESQRLIQLYEAIGVK